MLTVNRYNKKMYRKVFLFAGLTGVLIFLPFVIFDKGYFFFYGDFNVQQIPFYLQAHEAVRSGNLGWSWTTDLGANFIASYSFYLLGSPFFWLTVPFPTSFVPYLMAPLLILKMSCAATGAFAYLKRYVKTPEYAMLAALMYAFSGFSLYNIFFNHFHEAMVTFPLLLLSLDELIENDRRGWFALCVFFSAVSNYFFFVGQVVFVLIYLAVKIYSREFKLTFGIFLKVTFESVIGLLMSSILLLPSVLAIIQNPRVENNIYGWNALLYSPSQRYVHILQSFFFPPDIPARPNFTPDSNAKWASLGAYLPLFGMTGVIAWLQCKTGTWLKRILVILFIFALIPGLNATFYLFNSAYYARWFYMLTLMMAMATIKAFEDKKINWTRAIQWTVVITLGIALPIAFLLKKPYDEITDTPAEYGLMNYPQRLWIYLSYSLISIIGVIIILRMRKNGFRKKTVINAATFLMLFLTVMLYYYFITLGKTHSYNTHHYIIPYAMNRGADIKLPDQDSDSFRIDIYDGMDNLSMYWNLPSIQAFHSIVPASVTDFYTSVGVDRGVASRPEIEKYGLRSLLSVRWLFTLAEDDTFNEEIQSDPATEVPGWTYYTTQNGFNIYENENYIPMGFTYDSFLYESEFATESDSYKHLLLLKAIVLSDEDSAKYSDLLEHFNIAEANYSNESFSLDCIARRRETSSSYEQGNGYFTSEITLSKDNLVFFSVPYDEGWTACVNGKESEIIRSNCGFMAVKCTQGKNTITFTYKTPGLSQGIILTVSAATILTLYLLIINLTLRKSSSMTKLIKKLSQLRKNKQHPPRCYKNFRL